VLFALGRANLHVVNCALLASQLIRVLRGRRSQAAFSLRLGYRTNVVHTWEAGRGFPTAAKWFALLGRVGVDSRAALTAFYGQAPEFLAELDLTTAEGVRVLLNSLRGQQTLTTIAERVGRNRYAASRWFNGPGEPRLHEFLELIDACTLRLLDFLASFVDPADVPEAAEAWVALTAARKTAYELPWSHAILRMLELEEYRRLPRHEGGWFAQRLHLTTSQESLCLSLLVDSGQAFWNGHHYEPRGVTAVDTRQDRDAARALAVFWAQLGVARLSEHASGHFAYNLVAVSAADFDRLRELQRSYFAQLRAIVAASTPVERVAVVNMQLFPIAMESPAKAVNKGR
jgi:DNA-binding phage protein